MTPTRFALLRAVLKRRQPDLTLLAENTHKTQNIAALLRTCDAAGVTWMHVVADQPPYRHHRTSGGSRKWVPIIRHASVSSAIGELKKKGFQVLVAHQSRKSIDYRDADYARPTVIVVGSELWGASATAAALADGHIEIPMQGMVASLNVSVAAGLVLYEAARQREAAGLYAEQQLDDATFEKLLFEWAYPRIARRCRLRCVRYPRLAADGTIAENTFVRTD